MSGNFLFNMALQGSACVNIKPSAAKVDRRLEVLDVAESASMLLIF